MQQALAGGIKANMGWSYALQAADNGEFDGGVAGLTGRQWSSLGLLVRLQVTDSGFREADGGAIVLIPQALSNQDLRL